jgi:8-oxo-dGTP pyrophosphatase MutT (NUDIX family)
MAGAVAPWRILKSTITYKDRWLTLRSDECQTVEGRIISPYHVLEFPDWINVIPITREGRVVLVREYRHGAGKVVLGLVSGAVDVADGDSVLDAAEAAARRELQEETGFTGVAFKKVLECYANPANQANRATSFLVLDVEQTAERHLDETEAVEIVYADFGETLRDLTSGKLIMQAMHVAGLWAAAAHMLATPDTRVRALASAALG